MRVHGREVRGVEVDAETRCAHYGTARDVVAIRFACCDTFYPCHRCHAAVADHEPERLPVERREADHEEASERPSGARFGATDGRENRVGEQSEPTDCVSGEGRPANREGERRPQGAVSGDQRSEEPRGSDEPAVLCGVCGSELAAQEYMGVDACPDCDAAFNPACADHYHLYFEGVEEVPDDR